MRRKSHLPISTGGQPGRVLCARPFRSPGVHDCGQRRALAVRGHFAVLRQPDRALRQLGTDGLQCGLRDQFLVVVQRRSVRTQTSGNAHRCAQHVLLRRLPVHHDAVRGHRRLEVVHSLYHDIAARQRCGPVQGACVVW